LGVLKSVVLFVLHLKNNTLPPIFYPPNEFFGLKAFHQPGPNTFLNYLDFVDFQVKSKGMQAATLEVGNEIK